MRRATVALAVPVCCVLAAAACELAGAPPAASRPGTPAATPPSASTAPAPKAPTTGPAEAPDQADKGSIAIVAVQGTRGGPKVAGDKVVVELFPGSGEPQRIETKLDDHAVVVLEDLPLDKPFQPKVTVEHAGVSYHAVGTPMGPLQAAQKITVTVYETTDEEPPWKVLMRHVLVHPTPNGVQIREVIAVTNPADRAWLGRADAEGGRASISLDLPPGAAHVTFGGAFHSCCTRTVGSRVISASPLTPGLSQFHLAYAVPVRDGRTSVEITAPAPVDNLMVFVPKNGVSFHGEGLQPAGEIAMYQAPMLSYKAAGLLAGQRTAFALGGLPRAAEDQAHPGSPSQLPKTLAAVGGGSILLLCVVIFLIKPSRKKPVPGSR